MPDPSQPATPPAVPDVHALNHVTAIGYGFANAFGRFHKSDISQSHQNTLPSYWIDFLFGQALGMGTRAVIGGFIIFLTTGNITGAAISALTVVIGDQALTTSTAKKNDGTGTG